MSEATAPGWRPTYRGRQSLGRVGSGARLGAHLYYLYRAGRNDIPTVARTYALLAERVHHLTGTLEHLAAPDGRGVPAGHRRVLQLREEVHDVLRQTALRLEEVGTALVATAARYAETDRAAAAEFTRLMDDNAADYQAPPPTVPPPPAVGTTPAPVRRPADGRVRPQ